MIVNAPQIPKRPITVTTVLIVCMISFIFDLSFAFDVVAVVVIVVSTSDVICNSKINTIKKHMTHII